MSANWSAILMKCVPVCNLSIRQSLGQNVFNVLTSFYNFVIMRVQNTRCEGLNIKLLLFDEIYHSI